MKALMKVLKWIIEVFNIVSIAALVAMMLLVVVNVIMRYIFKNPIPGTYEMTNMLMICLSPCIAVNIMAKQCVWVDVLTSRFGRTGQMIIDIITLPTSVVMIGLIAWQSYLMIGSSIKKNSYSQIMTFRLYEWPFRLIFALAMTMACIAALVLMIERFMEYKNGGMPVDKSDADQAKEKLQELEALDAARGGQS